MCGIVGYVGDKQARDVVIEGLRRLEYRGYDSAGIALVDGGAIVSDKRAGKLANLEKAIEETPLPPSTTGIGHTRWATHGAPNDTNAHPHLGQKGRVAVVHNGIIENFAQLRDELEREGHDLLSETDTEVAAHLLEVGCRAHRRPHHRDAGRVPPAARAPSPWSPWTRRTPTGWWPRAATHRWSSGSARARTSSAPTSRRSSSTPARRWSSVRTRSSRSPATTCASPTSTARRPRASATTSTGTSRPPRRTASTGSCARRSSSSRARSPTRCSGRHDGRGELQLDEVRITEDELREVDRIVIIGCGTANYAGLVAKYAIEHWTRIPCEVELAHEFRYRDPILTRNTLVIAISQSGETADTLMAIRYARRQRAKVLAICNTNGSTIPRESDAVIYTHAGPEIGVASTKGFLTQLMACYLLGLYLAQVRGTKYGDEIAAVVPELEKMPAHVQRMLDQAESIYALARARRRPVGAVPRSARRLPGGARGRAQAQGAGLHPRRGLRGRRAQARPDRADRGGAAGLLRRAAPRSATSCTTR